jgi:hypothetical protein
VTNQENVRLELTELKKLGVKVSKAAFAWVDQNAEEIDDMRDNQGMRISDIADLARDLASF